MDTIQIDSTNLAVEQKVDSKEDVVEMDKKEIRTSSLLDICGAGGPSKQHGAEWPVA